MPAEPIIPSNKQESLQHPSNSAFCHKLLFHLWFFSSDGQNLSPWCWPLCSAAESSKYLSPEPAIPFLNQFQCTRTAEIGSHLLNGNSSLPLTLLLNTDDTGVGFKKVQKITKLRSWPDGPTWKLRFSTNLQFRKCRNCRIYLLLFRDRSNRKKVKDLKKKKKATENREGKHSKKQQRASPHRSLPSTQFGGFSPPTWSHCCRQDTRFHLGRQKLSYSPLSADPSARARAESRVMSLGLRMLPQQHSHLRGAPAGSLLHSNIYISCFLPGSIWAAFLQETDSLWWVLGSDVIPSEPVKQAMIAKERRRKKTEVALQAHTCLKHLYAVGERAPALFLSFLSWLYYLLFSSTHRATDHTNTNQTENFIDVC